MPQVTGVRERRARRTLDPHESVQRRVPTECENEADLTAEILSLANDDGRCGYPLAGRRRPAISCRLTAGRTATSKASTPERATSASEARSCARSGRSRPPSSGGAPTATPCARMPRSATARRASEPSSPSTKGQSCINHGAGSLAGRLARSSRFVAFASASPFAGSCDAAALRNDRPGCRRSGGSSRR